MCSICSCVEVINCIFLTDPVTTDIYTCLKSLSRHDALPICSSHSWKKVTLIASKGSAASVMSGGHPADGVDQLCRIEGFDDPARGAGVAGPLLLARKSTRLNSSH